ncbi:hypothetical protein GGR57DRAFT_338010 [Xylariaceae sp. FL1272]|nr:hypothetical protein GGR57DRAFT_338010 [Xylariaceae sp. FL1272]
MSLESIFTPREKSYLPPIPSPLRPPDLELPLGKRPELARPRRNATSSSPTEHLMRMKGAAAWQVMARRIALRKENRSSGLDGSVRDTDPQERQITAVASRFDQAGKDSVAQVKDSEDLGGDILEFDLEKQQSATSQGLGTGDAPTIEQQPPKQSVRYYFPRIQPKAAPARFVLVIFGTLLLIGICVLLR